MNNYRNSFAAALCLVALLFVSCAVATRPDVNAQTPEKAPPSGSADEGGEQRKVTMTLTFPLFSDFFLDTPVALVNEEPVTLRELRKEITSFHGEMFAEDGEGENAAASVEKNYLVLLNRVINTRLIVEEARNIGLDELPAIQAQLKDEKEKMLRKMLFRKHLDSVDVEVSEDEVTAIFRSKVKEYKMTTLLFKAKDDADRALEDIRSGKDFDTVAERLIEEGTAEGSEKGGAYVKEKDMLPHIKEIINTMEPGSASPVVNVPGGKSAIFKFDGVRYPDNPGELENAREMVRTVSRNTEVVRYMKSLVEKYVTVNEKLYKSLDLEDREAFKGFREDDRVLATVEGGDPVTVKDLAATIDETLFHGAEKTSDLNEKKSTVFDNMLSKLVLKKEALRLGLDKTDEYKGWLITYERGLLFGAFIDKAVVPEAKLTHAEVKGYYEEHKNEFMTPEMMSIDGRLVFSSRRHAEDAAVKLRGGTDLKWLIEHADGQVDKDPDQLMNFTGRIWSVNGLPEDVQKIVKGSKERDIRIYESPESDYYVLFITDVIPPGPRPFDDVKLEIAKELHGKKVAALVEEWAGKLKEAYPVEIFIHTNN